MSATVVNSSTGFITQVIGPVVDVEFPDGNLPEIYDALVIEDTDPTGKAVRIVTEVQQDLGENRVRSVAMSSTDGLTRGMKVTNTGAAITVPVGTSTLGRILNVLGEPVDEGGPVEADIHLPIHRPAPKLTDQNTNTEILETGKLLTFLLHTQKAEKSVFSAVQV